MCGVIRSDQNRKRGMHTRVFDVHALSFVYMLRHAYKRIDTCHRETFRRVAEERMRHKHSRKCLWCMFIGVCAEQSYKRVGNTDRQADSVYHRRVDFGLRKAHIYIYIHRAKDD